MFEDIRLILEKYIWPPKGLALILFDRDNKPVLYGGNGLDLPYSIDISDFGLNNKNSIASYALENNIPLNLYNISFANEDSGILKMSGKPIFFNDKLPDYEFFEQADLRKFDRSLVTKYEKMIT